MLSDMAAKVCLAEVTPASSASTRIVSPRWNRRAAADRQRLSTRFCSVRRSGEPELWIIALVGQHFGGVGQFDGDAVLGSD